MREVPSDEQNPAGGGCVITEPLLGNLRHCHDSPRVRFVARGCHRRRQPLQSNRGKHTISLQNSSGFRPHAVCIGRSRVDSGFSFQSVFQSVRPCEGQRWQQPKPSRSGHEICKRRRSTTSGNMAGESYSMVGHNGSKSSEANSSAGFHVRRLEPGWCHLRFGDRFY